MSSKSRSRPPAHQNSFKFQHNKNSRKTKQILANPIEGVCEKCHHLLEWKKEYRKYKPLTVPKKCVMCEQKKITRSYTIVCADCAKKHNVCAKCKESKPIVNDFDSIKKQEAEEKEKEKILASLRERDRRRYLNHLERGNLDSESSEEEGEEEAKKPKAKKKPPPSSEIKEGDKEGDANVDSDDEDSDGLSDDDEDNSGDEEDIESPEYYALRDAALTALKRNDPNASAGQAEEEEGGDGDAESIDSEEEEEEDEDDNPFHAALKSLPEIKPPAPEVAQYIEKYKKRAQEYKETHTNEEEEPAPLDLSSDEEERFLKLKLSDEPPVKSFVFKKR